MDAFPPAVLQEWIASGDLPNLAALINDGRYTPVDSYAGHYPGSTWPTFISATPPSVHGIHHFMHWDPSRMTYRRPSIDWCDYTPFWRKPAGDQPDTVIFDLPFSYEHSAIANVVEVHGWGLHDELAPGFSQPPGLVDELRRRYGRCAMKPDVLGPREVDVLRRELEDLVASVSMRVDIIEHLARNFPWRLFLAPFAETHRAGHWYWSERSTGVPREGLKRVAMAIDAELPRLRALVGPDDYFVLFSLHGMDEVYDLDRFNEPIIEYLEPRGTTKASRNLDPVRLANKVLPGGLRRAISASFSTALRDRLFGHYLAAGVDWSNVKLISHPSDGCLYLRANLKGRERDGILSAEEASRVLEETRQRLLTMSTPDGRPIITDARYTTELFETGPRSFLLPDLVMRASAHVPDTVRMGDGTELHVPWRGWRDGDHRPEGFAVQTGPGTEPGSKSEMVHGVNLARYICEPAGLQFRFD
jgi:predicted AlkP superfamily phosphohydrolase/phosphomutase